MDCEHAVVLLSARLDHEIRPDDSILLEAHLADCPACQATAEAFSLQHCDLQRAFEPRRAAAAAVAEHVNARLPAAMTRTPAATKPARTPWLQYTAVRIALVAGGVAASLALLLTWLNHPTDTTKTAQLPDNTRLRDSTLPPSESERLTPRARPADPTVAKLAEGAALETKPGERRRVGLPDGSVLFVNQNTSVHLDGPRSMRLDRGELFLEVASHGPHDGFTVKTAEREVTALGTKFEVRADDDQTGVVVTQGKVEVSGLEDTLQAGQALTAKGIEPAARASHLLDWTRDLMAAAESPLVPGSAYAGGSLIAVDANGQEAKLSLRRFTVDVHIEDGFARTTIDQTYFNQHPWRLEGTFYFPLPPDASLSRLAMYVADGSESNLMEGGMTERGHARTVYERIVNNQRDPALLEWVDGTTFKMRVFPLEGRQEKRILLAYTQRLSGLYGRVQYRFPAGHSLQSVREWNFRAFVKGGANLIATSPTHPHLKVEKQGNDLILSDHAVGARIDKDVALDLTASAGAVPAGPQTRFVRAELDGQNYLALRYRPDLPGKTTRQRRDWVFLYESSADRDPLLARTQIDVIRHLLSNVEHDDTFTLLTAGTRVHRFPESGALLLATTENIGSAVKWLDQIHLIGALDLGRAFRTVREISKDATNPYLVHLGSGMTAIGTPQKDLAELLPKEIPYVGIGVGKRWDRAFMKQLAEKTGGYFTQINPDETVSWRAFDLLATLNTPRLLNVQVAAHGLADSPVFLTDATTLAQGEELFAATRVPTGAPLPTSVEVTGTLDGAPFRAELPVKNVTPGAGYLPRTWAKWELDRELIDFQKTQRQQAKNDIVELSKAMYVMTPFTSLLVLENDKMYEEFKVDRGRKDHWALYPTPNKIPTVYEPLATEVDVRNAPQGLKPTPNQVLPTILMRGAPRFVNQNSSGSGLGMPNDFDDTIRFKESGWQSSDEGLRPIRLAELGNLYSNGRVELRSKSYTTETMLRRAIQPDDAFRVASGRGTNWSDFGDVQLGGLRAKGMQGRNWGVDAIVEQKLGRAENYYGLTGRNTLYDEPPIEFASAAGTMTSDLSYGYRRLSLDMPGRKLVEYETGYALGKQHWNLGYNPPMLAKLPILDALSAPRLYRSDDSIERYRELGLPSSLWADTNGSMMLGNGVNSDPGLTGSIVLSERQLGEKPTPRLTYDRPNFTANASNYSDLVSYAPGLNSSRADMLAVLDEEAAPDLRESPGTIDAAARKLIDRARAHGWQSLTLSAGERLPGVVLTFDGAGRYSYERVVSFGLHERVVCDGKTLLHLYPELGLGARRNVTRFHRAELANLVPWWLPPATDLARGYDLECVGERTVALVPQLTSRERKRPEDSGNSRLAYLQNQLVFAEDGRLAERQLVLMPEKKILVREIYDGKGGVRVLDADGKEVIGYQRTLEKAKKTPNLTPDTKNLVVLPLPFRARSHTFAAAYLDPNNNLASETNACFMYLDEEKVLSLLATLLAGHNANEAQLLVRTHFFDQGDFRPGLFTILAASGVDLRDESGLQTAIDQKTDSPLVRYFALGANATYDYLLRRGPINFTKAVAPADTFLGRLAVARDLTIRWQVSPPHWIGKAQRRTDVARTLAFVHDNRASVLGWALLLHMQRSGSYQNSDYLRMAKAWEELAVSPPRKQETGDFRAQYEQACCLADGGRTEEARKLFEELYARALKAGGLPAVESRFYTAMIGKAGDDDRWTPLMRNTAATFIKEKRRAAVVYLAWQCQQLGDPTLADTLLDTALDGATVDAERLIVHLSAIDYLSQIGQKDRALELMDGLLIHEKWSQVPALWRRAARLKAQCDKGDESITCLERALDLEYKHLPDVINLQTWRQDYGALLEHYRDLVARKIVMKVPYPFDFRKNLAARTIQAADRWRAHDPEATGACQTASLILRMLGDDELAWEYLTTPTAMQQERSSSVSGMATALSTEGRYHLAEYAYEVASQAEPNNPQIVWERALNLRRFGKTDEADRLLQSLAKNDNEGWEWRRVRERAEWELKRR